MNCVVWRRACVVTWESLTSQWFFVSVGSGIYWKTLKLNEMNSTYFRYSSRHARSPEFVARTMIIDTSLRHRRSEVGMNCTFPSNFLSKMLSHKNVSFSLSLCVRLFIFVCVFCNISLSSGCSLDSPSKFNCFIYFVHVCFFAIFGGTCLLCKDMHLLIYTQRMILFTRFVSRCCYIELRFSH